MRKLKQIIVALAFLPTIATVYVGADNQFTSSGNFTDAEGTVHPWLVTANHALFWDGSPYVPAGVVFHSKYVSIDQSEENWKSDVNSLETLKARGVTDLLIAAGGPISWTDPAAWQKLIDYLDSNGFTYGIDLFDGPTEDISGVIVRPNRYRLPNVSSDGDYSFNAPDVQGGFFILCSPRDGSVIRNGKLEVREERMIASVKAGRSGGYLLLVYPEIDMSGMEVSLPDVWTGFDDCRDRLLNFFSAVKFGKGLRFLLNPMSGTFGLTGDYENIIPNSAAFRLGFEAWLAKKYQDISNLSISWSINARDVRTFEEAARLIPLWYEGKGSPTLFDRTKGISRSVDVGASSAWDDIIQYRDLSIQSCMNSMAAILKRNVADIPILYRTRSFHRVYANAQQNSGYDGLAAAASGVGESLAMGEPAWACALAEESERTLWLLVSSVTPPEKSYPSKAALEVDLEFLKEIGMKGMYVAGVQTPSEWRNGTDLLASPQQFDWLKGYQSILTEASNFLPSIVKYPGQTDAGGQITRLGSGVWWLPSLQSGEPISLGSSAVGYVMKGEKTSTLWTTDSSPQKYTLPLKQGQEPRVKYPEDADNRAIVTRKGLEIELNGNPLVLTGIDRDQLVPFETAEQEVSELVRAYDAVQKADKKSPTTKSAIDRAEMVLKNNRTQVAYEVAHTELISLQETTGGYIWLEGEYPSEQNMTAVMSAKGASNGRYLCLNTKTDAPMAPYGATYQFQVHKEASYDIYLAGSILGNNSSAFTYSIDNGPWQAPESSQLEIHYGPSFGWHKLGSVTLPKGNHSISLNIVGRRRSDNTYNFAVDALLLTPWPFTPEGIKKPIPQY